MRIVRLFLASALLMPASAHADNVSRDALLAAAKNGLALLEATSPTFVKKGGCNSCHNQMLPAAAQAFARSRGVPVATSLAQLAPELSEATTERYVEYSIGGGGGISSLGYDFFASAIADKPASTRMLAQIHFIKRMQQAK